MISDDWVESIEKREIKKIGDLRLIECCNNGYVFYAIHSPKIWIPSVSLDQSMERFDNYTKENDFILGLGIYEGVHDAN